MNHEILATFQCSYTFSVRDINYFVINGNIKDGSIKIGQYINFFCDGYQMLKLKISGVQFVSYAKNVKNKFDISVECETNEELKQLDKIQMNDKIGFVTNE